ncbi:MAG: cell wall metabolism sensor histidine kinase WalK [Clostridia bacterium]|nr:cell wall metabolism sensor histidine kinase WalK [Clostridia bacterium]
MRYASIRFKLFAALCCLIIFFVGVSWLLNNFFLEKYYFYTKSNALLESYNKISSLYNGDPEKLYLELEKLESSRGLHVIIMDNNFNVVYNSRQKGLELKTRRFDRGFLDNRNAAEAIIKEKVMQILKGKPLIEKRLDSRLNSNFINLYALLDQKDFIFITTPVAAIQESAEIANKFFVFTGMMTIILGSVLVFVITSRFTKPILELNDIAQRMSTLDFSKRYPVKSHDEIGHLGESINSLSEQLEKSISELKEANEILKEDIERERRIDEMRKGFITNVSHELKTPIALIQGYAEGLKVNINDDEENKNYYCDVIMDESFKMNKLVRQLLDLSQMESGQVDLDRSDFDVHELVECVIKRNSIILKEKNIDVTVEKQEDISVDADYERIEQVFTNYLNNAINHVDGNKQMKVSIKRVSDKARVSVYNSGQHIPAESLDKLWTSFYKVDKARTRSYGGTGLGLSIVKAIQEAHNNRYGVENVEGGVVFWFELDVVGE